MRRTLALLLFACTAAGPVACSLPSRPAPQPLAGSPDEFIEGFRSRHSLELALELQALSQQDRLARLRKIANSGPRPAETFVLCRLLFEPRPGEPFPRPLLGAPVFVGADAAQPLAAFPLEPIELRDGVPILVVRGYSLGGLPDTPAGDLQRCLDHARWRTTPLTPRTPAQIRAAFDGFLRDHPVQEHDRAFLLSQAD